jgi:uncharacterized protein YdeI (YjbR/CyaY-like superfamily)
MKDEQRKVVEVANLDEWRAWLEAHHEQQESVLLVTYRKGTSDRYIPTPEIVEEALCFGWIDSTRRKIDDNRSTLLISPRRPRSGWSAINKARVERLIAEGRMTSAGMAKIEQARADGSWTRFDDLDEESLPSDLATALASSSVAGQNFDAFPPSYRRMVIGWVRDAKRQETRERRIERIVSAAALDGGEGGIRTRGGCDTSTVFKTAPFVHSGTSPPQILPHREAQLHQRRASWPLAVDGGGPNLIDLRRNWGGGRAVEGARLLSEYRGLYLYRGFESLPLRRCESEPFAESAPRVYTHPRAGKRAPVAQGIERWVADSEAGGSNPPGRTTRRKPLLPEWLFSSPHPSLSNALPPRTTMTSRAGAAIISRGEVSEWFKVLLSKSSVLSKAPRVRIPPSPPPTRRYHGHGRVA